MQYQEQINNIVIRTDSRLDDMVRHLGYVSVPYHDNAITDVELIRESQKRLRQTEIISDDQLNSVQRVHLNLARLIAKNITNVPNIHAAIIPSASNRVRTAGLYNRKTCEIYISVEQLNKLSNTIDTVIHELAHHTSGAEDLQEAHAKEMCRICDKVIDLVDKGCFNDLLKNAVY